MSKKKIFPIIILTITFLLICGYISHKNKKEHYIQTQEKRIDLYFKYNLKDYHSMQVTKFKKNPMGGYFIKGYINNDKKYDFDATIFSGHSTQFKGDIGYDDKTLGKLFISDDPKKLLTPNDIIKKEHLDKDKYEAEPPAFFFF
ncbi:DUF1433 domain-containing protein [Staphylococcus warneri]|uniref:DUF1433 domain-containing protein n=1 Tax=Staphylococcus warneri TaxID=1292 RepID=UPI000D1E2388|nr:DUF1433 domain-containing protein [Staphylococcus warneri]PTI34601.1 hypothetical protein BU079_05805 [Staphylococcus warneri]